MNTLTFAVLTIAATSLGRNADNEFGRVAFGVVAAFMFAVALLSAPWSEVLA